MTDKEGRHSLVDRTSLVVPKPSWRGLAMANGAMLCRAKQPQTSGNSMTTNPDSTSTFTSSRWRRVFFYSLFFVAAGIAAVGAIGSPRGVGQPERIDGSPSPQARSTGRVADNAFHLKIAPWVLEHTLNGQQAEFFVVLADQADLSGTATFATKAEKSRYVYETLFNKAQTTQGTYPAMVARPRY